MLNELVQKQNSGISIYYSNDQNQYSIISVHEAVILRDLLNNGNSLYVFDKLFKVVDLHGYYAIAYKFNNNSYNQTKYLADAISIFLKGSNNGVYHANTDFETIMGNSTINITWSWDYGEEASDTGHDKYDSFLGDLIENEFVEGNFVHSFGSGAYYHPEYQNGKLVYRYHDHDLKIANTKSHFGFTITASQVD